VKNLVRVLNNRLFHLLTGAGCLLLLFSCATTPLQIPEDTLLLPPGEQADWQRTSFTGFKTLVYNGREIPVQLHAIAFDRSLFDFDIVLTPPDESGRSETRTARVSRFAEEQNVLAAMNAAPYAPVDILNRQNRPGDIAGIFIYEGEAVSPPVQSYDAFFVLGDGSFLIGSQKEIPSDVQFGIGGFHIVLKDGITQRKQGARHPRSVIGLSADGETLYMAVFDGRQPDCAGMTGLELGLWMKWLGADDAINMDGGGSSSLVLQTDDGYEVLNTPIHRGRPGLERAVASHIGIRPLPSPKIPERSRGVEGS
jgi:hypothetical protein